MGKVYPRIDDDMRVWVAEQHVFFVATAPLAAEGMVNCSPKGLDSLRIVDDRTLAYLDLTGSGVETIAHLKENRRIVIMLCAFEGPPRIVRFHGQGEAVHPGHPAFSDLMSLFPPKTGVRSIIRIAVERVADSCGYGVPRMNYQKDRDGLLKWSDKLGAPGIADYKREKNAGSLDGLPGVDWLG